MRTEVEEVAGSFARAWNGGRAERRTITAGTVPGTFVVRHHSFTRRDPSGNEGGSTFSEHVFRSPLECLVNLRDVVIPEMLREASGLRGEADLEVLLDGSGYSVSLVAEELLSMIGECIDSNAFNSRSLERIRRVYNGLSGFNAPVVRRIARWGFDHFSAVNLQAPPALSTEIRAPHSCRCPAGLGSNGALAV